MTGRTCVKGLGAMVGEVARTSSSESSKAVISAAERLRDGRDLLLRAGYERQLEEHLWVLKQVA